MSILIKGMEMPKDGTFNIVHIYADGHVSMPCWGKGMQIVQDIEAVPVPKHGRLIDADAPIPLVDTHGKNIEVTVAHIIENNLGIVNAIIEAEEGET